MNKEIFVSTKAYFVCELDISSKIIWQLEDAGIFTISKLLEMHPSLVIEILGGGNYYGNLKFDELKCGLMDKGYVYNFYREIYTMYNISDEYIFMKISNLNIPDDIKDILIAHGINYLGDLLITNYSQLMKILKFNEEYIKALENLIYELGFTFPSEEVIRCRKMVVNDGTGRKDI